MTTNPGGRPRALLPDDRTLKLVTGLASIMCTTKDAAAALGVSEPTFIKFKSDYPQAKEAWEMGQGQARVSLRRKQWKLADKSPAMAIFLGKNYLDQTDRQEHTGPNGGPIEYSRLSPEERRRRIDELQAKRGRPGADVPDGE